MKIFYDCEFLEGTQKKRFLGIPFGKTKPTIDLISIGLVSELGTEYYAISKEFNLREAWYRYDLDHGSGDQRNSPPRKVYWIRENVLRPIYEYLYHREIMESWDPVNFTFAELQYLIEKYGKTNNEISMDIREFVCPYDKASEWAGVGPIETGWKEYVKANPPELYGYYSAYDHVAFSWLFGKMIDLPDGFPMYTRDLKQMIDVKAYEIYPAGSRTRKADVDDTLEDRLTGLKRFSNYPKQTNEHSALDDARWNKKLYEFLMTLS